MRGVMDLVQKLKCVGLAVALVIVGTKAEAGAPALVESVKSYRDGDTFTTELKMKSVWSGDEVHAQFAGEAVQIDFPDAGLAKEKKLVNVEDRMVKSVYLSQPDSSSLRTRVAIKKGLIASSLENSIRIRRAGSVVSIDILGDAMPGKSGKNETEITRVVAVSDEKAAEETSDLSVKLVADASVSPATYESTAEAEVPLESELEAGTAIASVERGDVQAGPGAIDTNKLPESEIPVLAKVKEDKKASAGSLHRILISLGVLVVILGSISFGLKRWAGRSRAASASPKIKVLTQHHLGPKKSLAIVQVAGESILVGITDHNISMLKTLSLLDEEIPEKVPNSFGSALNEFDDEEDFAEGSAIASSSSSQEPNEDFAMRGLTEIRDVVSSRLKNMRNL